MFVCVCVCVCVCVILGYGVSAEQKFAKGDFVLQYKGDLIDSTEAKNREEEYKTCDVGCFMYYFVHCGQKFVKFDIFNCIIALLCRSNVA